MKEPTVREFLDMADDAMRGSFLNLTRAEEAFNKGFPPSVREESYLVKFNSDAEKQRPKGKPDARHYVVQTAKGNMFALRHRESGDWYNKSLVVPITSWGATRFLSAKEAHDYLNDSKNFAQPKRKLS